MMLGKALSPYVLTLSSHRCAKYSANIWLDNVKINKFAHFDPNITIVISIFINWPQPAETLVHQKSPLHMPVVR